MSNGLHELAYNVWICAFLFQVKLRSILWFEFYFVASSNIHSITLFKIFNFKCLVDSWVKPNMIHLVKWVKLLNPDPNHLDKRVTRHELHNSFNKHVVLDWLIPHNPFNKHIVLGWPKHNSFWHVYIWI